MESLNSLIIKLNTQEISLVRSYVQHLNAKDKGDNVILKLFDYLVKHAKQNPDIHQCSQFLYGKNSDNKFRMIRMKLRAKILDALVIDKNVELNAGFDEVDEWTLKLRKKVTSLNYIFHSKGSIPITFEIIEEVLAKGLKYENYQAMVDVLKLKKYLKGFSSGIKEFNAINKQIAFYEYCDMAKNKAVDHYYKLITRTDFRSSLDRKTIKRSLLEAMLDLKSDLKYTKSGLVTYYLKLLERAYFQILDDYTSSRNSSVEMLSVVRDNPSVYRKQRIGIAFLNIGECDIFLKDYIKAVSNFRAAQKIFSNHSKNYLVSKELELKTLIYANEIPQAERALKEIVDHPDINIMGDFRQSRYDYYKANLFFKKGKFKEALRMIAQHLEMSKDKTGWEIGNRILSILCMIELGNDDQATTQIGNLLQHIKRSKIDGQEISERDAKIVQILFALSQNGFMFNTLNDKTMVAFVSISGNDKKCDWEPLGAELIPFHEWMGEKLKLKKQLTSSFKKQKSLTI